MVSSCSSQLVHQETKVSYFYLFAMNHVDAGTVLCTYQPTTLHRSAMHWLMHTESQSTHKVHNMSRKKFTICSSFSTFL